MFLELFAQYLHNKPVIIVPITNVVDNVFSISSMDENYNLNSVALMKDSEYNLNHSLPSRNDLTCPTLAFIVEDCLLFCKLNLLRFILLISKKSYLRCTKTMVILVLQVYGILCSLLVTIGRI